LRLNRRTCGSSHRSSPDIRCIPAPLHQ
jgi:hypothetical protein